MKCYSSQNFKKEGPPLPATLIPLKILKRKFCFMKKHGLNLKSMLPQMPILSGFIDPYGDLWIYETGAACNDTQLHINLSPRIPAVFPTVLFFLWFFPMFRLLSAPLRHIKRAHSKNILLQTGSGFSISSIKLSSPTLLLRSRHALSSLSFHVINRRPPSPRSRFHCT